MMLSEFIERTGVQPTAEEYENIEREYYSFSGDKDAFCRAWKRANPASVKAAKERMNLCKLRCKLLDIHERIRHFFNLNGTFATMERKTSDFLKLSELCVLVKLGIIRREWEREQSLLDTKENIDLYIKSW